MTTRQKEILNFIDQYVCEHGFSPTFAEIATGTGIASKSTIFDHLGRLKAAGYITYREKTPRTISITPIGFEMIAEDYDY